MSLWKGERYYPGDSKSSYSVREKAIWRERVVQVDEMHYDFKEWSITIYDENGKYLGLVPMSELACAVPYED
jgi:hypothetical protein